MSDGFNVSKYLNFSNTFPEKENISTSAILIEKNKLNMNFQGLLWLFLFVPMFDIVCLVR
jgi:hypothetical protein